MGQKHIVFEQVMLNYVPNEDRILMRLNSNNHEQFIMAFSRRFVKTIWPPLIYVLSADPNFSTYDQATKQAAMQFKNEEVVSKADKAKPFNLEDMSFPWGKEPVLATKAMVRNPESSSPILGIYAENNLGFDFPSDSHILHYLYKGLSDMVRQAEWALDLTSLGQSIVDKNKLN